MDEPLPSTPESNEIATTGDGRDITRAHIGPLLIPQDTVLASKGGELTLYEELLRDPQVYATFQQRRDGLIAREWEVVAGAEDRQSEMAADFMREMLAEINFDRVTRMMHFGVFYGYAVGELMYARDGRFWTIDQIKVRKARRFRFDPQKRLRLITENNRTDGELMPPAKFWTYSAGADNHDEPYGLGLGHWLYWPVWFKRNGIKFWAVYLDKFGMPTAVGKYPVGTSQDDQEKLLEAVRAIQTDSGIVIPEGMMIELVEAARSGTSDYQKFHDTMDAAIAKVVLSQTMTTDDGSSLSQAEVHDDVKDDVVKSDADLLCGSFNTGPAHWLTEWNFPGAVPPKVWRIMEDPEDVNVAAERDVKLYSMGWEPSEERIERTYGDGYVRRQTAAPEPDLQPGTPGPEFSEADEDEIDALADQLDRVAGQAMDNMINQVRTILNEAETFSEAQEKLLELRSNLNPDKYAEALRQAFVVAELDGRRDMLPSGF